MALRIMWDKSVLIWIDGGEFIFIKSGTYLLYWERHFDNSTVYLHQVGDKNLLNGILKNFLAVSIFPYESIFNARN